MTVPEALACASIAGVSPVVGLYAAPGALIFYAAFGSSRHLVVGPMAAPAALSAAAVGEVAAGLLRLGCVANFISEPVLKGFIVGLALTIIVGQVPKLLGDGGTPEYRRTVQEAVQAVQAVPPTPVIGEPPTRRSNG